MSLISKVIRSLINGISQQAPSVRLDNQLEDQVNMIPDIAAGLTRRNPVELDDIIAHDGSRTYTEEHAMFDFTIAGEHVCIGVKQDGTVYRFDKNHEGTLVQQSATVTSYLVHTDPNDIRAIETSDRLILLNRGVEVELDYTGYTAHTGKEATGSHVDAITADFSSTMDAYLGVAVNDSGSGTTNITASNFYETVVIWKDDYTEYSVYTCDAEDFQDSPNNALKRVAPMNKVDGISNGYTGTKNDTTWKAAMPAKILVEASYERSSENVRVAPYRSESGTSTWEFYVTKGSGAADCTYNLTVGDYTSGDVTVDTATYGNWNGTTDTLDLSSFSITVDGQVYSFEYYQDAGNERQYYMSAILDKNMPSYYSGLPIKWQEHDDSASNWIIQPEGNTPHNTEAYGYSQSGSPQYTKVTGAFNSAITDVHIAHPDATFRTINSGSNADQLPSGNREDLGTLTIDYSTTERVLTGWCITNDVDNDEAWYCNLHQEVDPADYKGLISVGDRTLTVDSDEYSSVLEANEITTLDYKINALVTGRLVRDAYSHSIPLIQGSADFYKFSSKTIRATVHSRSLIWVTQAHNEATYTVKWVDPNGNEYDYVSITTSDGTSSANTPESIIDELIAEMVAQETTFETAIGFALDITEHKQGNSVIVRGEYLSHFKVECDFGDYIHTVAEARPLNNSTLTDPSILPPRVATNVTDCLSTTGAGFGTTNFLVRVNPDVNESLNTYYLIYSDEFEAWIETSDYYIDQLNIETMPVSIRKNKADSLTVEHTKIKEPLAGDNSSNPPPSFLNKKIKDLIVFNGRLGFASENTLVFSVISDYFNVYRTTTADYLITDVVDLELDSSKLGYREIDNVFTLDNNLVINTGLSQSILAIPTNMDISSAIFAQASSFDLGTVDPISVRRSMYFPIKQGNFTTVKAFAPDTDTGIGYTDNSTTKHCEKLIRGEVTQAIFTNDVYMVRTDYDAKTIYVQHTYVVDGVILQNAWHKWTFALDIKHIYSQGEIVHFVFEDHANSQTVYASMGLTPQEIVEDTDIQIGYEPYLDFKTEDTALSALLDNVITVDKAIGKLVTSGDANSVDGILFPSSFTLSQIVPRTTDQSGQTKLGYALLMLRRMSIALGYSGQLDITVSRTNRPDYVHNYVPDTIGTIVIGREPVTNESARFPVNGRSEDVTVKIADGETFTPIQAQSVEWQGQLITKGGK